MRSNGEAFEIREAGVGDAAAILEVQKLAFRGQAELYGDFTLPPLVQSLKELRRDFETYTVLKAQAGDRIVGAVRARVSNGTCHIERLCVHPDFQNRGIGRQLMEAIEGRFSTVRRYELFTGHLSAKNLALYATLGYREFGRRQQSDKVLLICMEKVREARQG